MSISLDMIFWIFKLFFIALPLIFAPWNSELFEFNKMILVYLATILVLFFWGYESIKEKKFIFKTNKLDYFLAFFLVTQILSTLLSIDTRTSFLGYYSRWNGGLLSMGSYAVLYKAYSLFIDKKQSLHLIKVIIFSSFLASLYAGLEHFGYSPSCLMITGKFNVDCWVQDVQNRVFGTFGQPNWLAAWVVALLPLTCFFSIKEKKLSQKVLYLATSFLFITALYYTKSRSGALALGVAYLMFWISSLFLLKKKVLAFFLLTTSYILLATVFISTPWQINLVNKSTQSSADSQQQVGTALENGGTESGSIRKIVWKGAFDLFKKYPLFGSGLETFAYAYYQTRPVEHNLTSEWNFLYNKAHNEYLNYLSTTGFLGFLAYIVLILFIISTLFKKDLLNMALLSGFMSILVTNFFGFSTVPINVLFFIFPAIALTQNKSKKIKNKKLDNRQKMLIGLLALATFYMLLTAAKYWYADYLYAKSIKAYKEDNLPEAIRHLENATNYFPNEPIFTVQLAEYYVSQSPENSLLLLNEVEKYILFNIKLLKQRANIYSDLAKLDRTYLQEENMTISNLVKLAPTDASINYMYAVSFAKLGKIEEAISQLEKTINMKPDYKLARKLLGYIYEDLGNIEKAREQYEYILKNIDPNDEVVKRDLENLKKS